MKQSMMLSGIPGSKSQRPQEDESWAAIDLHWVMFNNLTAAGSLSFCATAEDHLIESDFQFFSKQDLF